MVKNDTFLSRRKSKFKIIVLLALFTVYILASYSITKPLENERLESSRKKQVLIVLSAAPKCDIEGIIKESLLNKQQYAQLKGYDVIFNQQSTILTREYTKIAFLCEVLRNQSIYGRTYEWIFWIDMDTLIFDMSFDIPFWRYQKVNMMIWGDKYNVRKLVDGLNGVNSGVFLLRNNDWSLDFIETVFTFGLADGRARESEMKSIMYKYSYGLTDQNAIVYVLKTYSRFKNYVFFETSYELNRYWLSVNYINDYILKKKPFIIHYAGCRFCNPNYIKSNTTKAISCFSNWKSTMNFSTNSYLKEANRFNNLKHLN